MKIRNSDYPKDWLKIAKKDFERVEKLLKINDHIAAGFYLQQAVEKFLKAFLLDHGWKLKRLHDLEILLNDAIKYKTEFEMFRNVCQQISIFYFTERYPYFMDTAIDEKDVNDAFLIVKKLVIIIEEYFKK